MQNRKSSDNTSNKRETKQRHFSRVVNKRNAAFSLVLLFAFCIWSIWTGRRNVQQVYPSLPKDIGTTTASTMGNDIPVNANENKTIIAVKPHILVNVNENKTIYFSQARRDRSGSVIVDMLMCHAYSFRHNVTYGGACRHPEDRHTHDQNTLYLLKSAGLQDILPFSCPNMTAFPNSKIIPDSIYRQNDTHIFTRNYVDFIRHQVRYSPLSNSSKPSIAVHIRRGDVDLCGDVRRYMPNSHFLSLIEKYSSGDGNHVTIYSESQYRNTQYVESF
jgi:hypothetical protein